MKKILITTAICFFAINANAMPPLPPYSGTGPTINVVNVRHNSNDQTTKALAVTAIALGLIAIMIELQPSYNDGQVVITRF